MKWWMRIGGKVLPKVFPLACGFISGAYGYHYVWFLNFWVGAVLGMFVQALWIYSSEVGKRETISTSSVLGIGFIALFAAFLLVPMMEREVRMIATLSQFDQETISRIEVFESRHRTWDSKILTITEPDDIAAFTQSFSDVVGYSPSRIRSRSSRSWYVTVSGPTIYELDLLLDPKWPGGIVGYSRIRSGSSTSSEARFRSDTLLSWVEEHLW